MEETREAEDAFWCVLGYSQEYLDRVHRKADEYREAVLAAGGRIGPQMSLEEASAVLASYESDSDFDDKHLAPLSPPLTPKDSDGGSNFAAPLPPGTDISRHGGSFNHPDASQGPLTTISSAEMDGRDEATPPLPTPAQSQSIAHKRRLRPNAITVSDRITRSKASSTATLFYELASDGRTSRYSSTTASPTYVAFRMELPHPSRRARTSHQSHAHSSKYRINKRR